MGASAAFPGGCLPFPRITTPDKHALAAGKWREGDQDLPFRSVKIRCIGGNSKRRSVITSMAGMNMMRRVSPFETLSVAEPCGLTIFVKPRM
jgi:hypothetical protein